MRQMNIDLISRETLKKNCISCFSEWCSKERRYCETCPSAIVTREMIDNAPDEWIPVTTRPCTDEEFEEMKELFGENIERDDFPFFDCPMPDDGQEILITTAWGVEKDTCEYDRDYGYTLEERGDWEGVTAWMPSPEPYKGGNTNDDLQE